MSSFQKQKYTWGWKFSTQFFNTGCEFKNSSILPFLAPILFTTTPVFPRPGKGHILVSKALLVVFHRLHLTISTSFFLWIAVGKLWEKAKHIDQNLGINLGMISPARQWQYSYNGLYTYQFLFFCVIHTPIHSEDSDRRTSVHHPSFAPFRALCSMARHMIPPVYGHI